MNQPATPRFHYLTWLPGGLCTVRLDDGLDVVLVHTSNHLARRHLAATGQAKAAHEPMVGLVEARVTAGLLVVRLNRLLARQRRTRRIDIAFPDDPLHLAALNTVLAPRLLAANGR